MWYLTAAARSNEQNKGREIRKLKIYVKWKLILICFYAQFSPLSTLFWTLFCLVYNELLCLRDQKYLVLSSFVRFLPLEMHPLAWCITSWAIHNLQNTRTKRLPATPAAWSPNLCLHLDCLRVLDANYHTVTHGGDPAGCKGCIIIFSTGIPEYVIQCKVLSQWITIYTLHP